jgi:hypothetical protein
MVVNRGAKSKIPKNPAGLEVLAGILKVSVISGKEIPFFSKTKSKSISVFVEISFNKKVRTWRGE